MKENKTLLIVFVVLMVVAGVYFLFKEDGNTGTEATAAKQAVEFNDINLKQNALIKNLKIAPKNPPHPTKSKSLKLIFTPHHKFFA